MTATNLTTTIMTTSNAKKSDSEFERFESMAKDLLSVTKDEIDEVHKKNKKHN